MREHSMFDWETRIPEMVREAELVLDGKVKHDVLESIEKFNPNNRLEYYSLSVIFNAYYLYNELSKENSPRAKITLDRMFNICADYEEMCLMKLMPDRNYPVLDFEYDRYITVGYKSIEGNKKSGFLRSAKSRAKAKQARELYLKARKDNPNWNKNSAVLDVAEKMEASTKTIRNYLKANNI